MSRIGKNVLLGFLLILIPSLIIDYWDWDLRIAFFLSQNKLPAWVEAANWVYRIIAFPAIALLAYQWVQLLLLLKAKNPTTPAMEHKFRQIILVFFLTFMVSGFWVNIFLKNTIPRPRPKEVMHFENTFAMPFWTLKDTFTFKYSQHPSLHKKYPWGDHYFQSFPSGHASLAFVFLGLWFFSFLQDRRIRFTFFASALLWGLAAGAARMVQAGHFLSDVLWAAWFDLFFAYLFWKVCQNFTQDWLPKFRNIQQTSTKIGFWILMAISTGFTIFLYFFAVKSWQHFQV